MCLWIWLKLATQNNGRIVVFYMKIGSLWIYTANLICEKFEKWNHRSTSGKTMYFFSNTNTFNTKVAMLYISRANKFKMILSLTSHCKSFMLLPSQVPLVLYKDSISLYSYWGDKYLLQLYFAMEFNSKLIFSLEWDPVKNKTNWLFLPFLTLMTVRFVRLTTIGNNELPFCSDIF